MGSFQGITYEEIKAYQASMGIETYAYNSGGYVTGGIWINWDRDTGFSGAGWYTGVQESPVYGMSEADIHLAIDQGDGTLNAVFSNWVSSVDYDSRYRFILDKIPDGCRYEVLG